MPDESALTMPAPGPALSATSDLPGAPVPETTAESAAAPQTDAGAEGVDDAPSESDTPAAADDEDGEPGAEPASEPGRKRQSTAYERVFEVRQARKAAEQRADRLAESLAEAIAVIKQVAIKPVDAPAPPSPPAEDPRPQRAQFDDPDVYDEALITWSSRQAARLTATETEARIAERVAREREDAARTEAERRAREENTAIATAWQERSAKFAEEHPDFQERVMENASLPISTPMADAIGKFDNGPAVAYHLAEHPEEAARIAGLVIPGAVFPATGPDGKPWAQAGQPVPDAPRQYMEMGRLAAQLTASPVERAAPLPRPPRPVNPNGGSRARTLEDVGNEGSTEEYAALRMPQLQAARRPFMPRTN